MDMVNDGKDIRLDTPQAVKEALASGKDLYNPETGEFWWEYNDTGSIANTYVYLDDPNLLAVIDNPDFDLFDDIVGGLNYTGYITDSPDYYAENADDYPDAPDYDERDAVFAQIASEDGHAVLREAVQVTSHGRVVSNVVHERPVTIHGESARARAAAAVLAANMEAEEEAEDKEEKSRNR